MGNHANREIPVQPIPINDDSEESDLDENEGGVPPQPEEEVPAGAERLFRIQPDDICIGLFGASCAGKSSLIKLILHRICEIHETEPIICGHDIIRVYEGPVELRAPVVLQIAIPNLNTTRRLLLIDFPGFSVHDVGAGDRPRPQEVLERAADTVQRLLNKFMHRIDYYIWVVPSRSNVDSYTISPDVLKYVYPLKRSRLLNRLLIVSTFGDVWPSPESPGAQNWRGTLLNAVNHNLESRGKAGRITEHQILLTATKGYSFRLGEWRIEDAAGPEWWQPLATQLRADLSDGSAILTAIDARQLERNQSKARWIFWLSFAAVVGVPFVVGTAGLVLLTAGAILPVEALVIGAVVAPVGGVAAGAGAGAGVRLHQPMIDWLAERHPAVPIEIEPEA